LRERAIRQQALRAAVQGAGSASGTQSLREHPPAARAVRTTQVGHVRVVRSQDLRRPVYPGLADRRGMQCAVFGAVSPVPATPAPIGVLEQLLERGATAVEASPLP
jgi:hypothetical protein